MPPVLKKVLLVEDHPLMREMLKLIIIQQAGMVVCAETDNVHEAVRMHEEMGPDLALVDLTLRGGNGLDLIKILRDRGSRVPVLVISMHSEQIYAERVMKAGANGYVSKLEPVSQILAAIRKVSGGGIHLSETVAQGVFRKFGGRAKIGVSSDLDSLSDRELEIFRLFGAGLNSREISGRIHLAVSSVDSYRSRIREKLGIRNAAELYQRAAYWVTEQGL